MCVCVWLGCCDNAQLIIGKLRFQSLRCGTKNMRLGRVKEVRESWEWRDWKTMVRVNKKQQMCEELKMVNISLLLSSRMRFGPSI